MTNEYRKMVEKLAAMSDEDLFTVWANLINYNRKDYYAPGVTMDEWAMEVYGQLAYRELPSDVGHAQGGGIVAYDPMQLAWMFVANPPEGFKIGDFMPEEWGIA